MKLAVIFPGVGYQADKPLLYYSKKIAASCGYEILTLTFTNFPSNIKGSSDKMKQAFDAAMLQAEHLLERVDFDQYDSLLFISKSIGTVVAAAYARQHELKTNNVFYTPVEEFFTLIGQRGIVFHGTKDPWAETAVVERGCKRKDLPLYIIEDANHSLETGDVLEDVKNLRKIMKLTEDYIEEL